MRIRRENQTITVIVFVVILLAMGLLHFVFPEKEKSEEEGRQLRRFPELNFQDAKTGEQSVKLEDWFSDQFPFRSTLIEIGKGWRKIAWPNLNKDGIQILVIDHDLTGDDGPDEPVDPEPSHPPVTPPSSQSPDPDDTEPSGPAATTTTEPPPIPTIEEGEVRKRGGIIIIKDRALDLFYGNEKNLKAYSERLNVLANNLPVGTQLYSMVVPTSVEMYAPDSYHSGYSSQKGCIEIINNALKPNIKTVNAYDKLLQNRDKYIYYRTDHHWTGLGAYYAYVAFCESAGWAPVTLDQMEHYQIEGTYLGSLYRATKDSVLKKNPDTTEGWKPAVDSYKATAWDDGDMTVTYGVRLNDERSKGTYSYLNFSGGDRALLKIVTSHTSGRKILVIKDSYGNAFTPYLANHYDEIYIIDPRYYKRSIKSLVSENGINDVMMLNYIFATSNSTWLKGFDAINK